MSLLRRLSTYNSISASPHLLFNSDGVYICSVIAANKGDDQAEISLWINPGNIGLPEEQGHVLSNLQIDPNDAYESFRFAINNADALYVESSTSSVSFNMFGINQTAVSASA